MKHIIIILSLLLFVQHLFAQEEKLRVAVFDPTSSGTAIDEGSKVAVRELISSTFVNTGKYIIVERSLLEKVMKEQEFSNSGVVDDNQATEIGKLAGAHKVVISVVTLVGGRNMLSVKVIDVKTATIDQQKTKLVQTNDLLDAVEPLTQELIGVAVTAQTAPTLPKKNIEPVHANATSAAPLGGQRNGESYNPDGIELVYIAGVGAGTIATKGFYIGKYEVTQAQWEAIMGNNPSAKPDPSHPVNNVSWNDVKQFLTKLNEKTGRNYRLPSESEWVHAARGGSNNDNYEYAGSRRIKDVAWYDQTSGSNVHPVGTKKPNSAGIYDMSGNVFEWCEDWFDGKQTHRVRRGGSWHDGGGHCLVLTRNRFLPDKRTTTIGFRVVCSSE
ncbi:MAG: SUMF1/EgtB/PvdO family nonheme iron enzyme [Dysgonamonadaceae bacterium]|jgi:formylglycine-generating enzyme required for sulfatase activity|nr:SUMF1/EgtB/PvdO family nonheme iron enzyme [Dysgonamonadaceae bacterium]